ncbi:MAG: 50S ribosomal protein L5 [Chloroflexota bacterium]|nr:50S ribosomal protein L5 [Chloroflexota bacterium]
MTRVQQIYFDEVKSQLQEEFGYKNTMQIPKIEKININVGMGESLNNKNAIEAMQGDLTLIAGQKPVVTKAKISIANFNLREGMRIGLRVTLRSKRMWDFWDRLVNLSLPRIRDFRGLSRNSFDGNGNYNLGIREHIIFPEIDYGKVDKIRGFQITIVTSAKNDQEGLRLMQLLGMPFVEVNNG